LGSQSPTPPLPETLSKSYLYKLQQIPGQTQPKPDGSQPVLLALLEAEYLLGGKTTHKIMQTQQTTKACRKGTAMWIGMSIGIAIGAAVGVAMQDVPQGVAIGVALGTAVGAAVTFAKPKRD
jgi:hypothetical protein